MIEKIVTEVKEDKLRQALLKEIIEGKSGEKEKPKKGFWGRLVDNMKAYRDDDEKSPTFDPGEDTIDLLLLGNLPSSIHHHKHFRG